MRIEDALPLLTLLYRNRISKRVTGLRWRRDHRKSTQAKSVSRQSSSTDGGAFDRISLSVRTQFGHRTYREDFDRFGDHEFLAIRNSISLLILALAVSDEFRRTSLNLL